MKERNFLKDQRNDRSLFIGKLDQEETARLTKNIKRKEIEKQRAILAAQKTSYDDNESLGDEVEEEMEPLAKDDLSYEVIVIQKLKPGNQLAKIHHQVVKCVKV